VENSGVIFLPIHAHGNHWTCITCDLQSGSMSYLDSLPPADEYVAYSLFKKLWKLLDRTCSRVPIHGLPESWTVEIAKSPQQQNTYDCGLYVCQAMRATMLGIPFQVSSKEMRGFRKNLLESLQRWSHPASEVHNLQLLSADEVFMALIINGTSVTRKKKKGSQKAPVPMEIGKYSFFMFTSALRPSF
jgi:hypothetical protein